ncbi:MAG: alpha-L-fucosidase [candidate division KSB1 bacterium]|nr:alpha-L-fucosidase [candidate division KSB1 bacterium]
MTLSCDSLAPPAPFGPVPSTRQLAWHKLEYYAFIHFGMNTFTDREWGDGREDPTLFNPTALDCRQWARVCKQAGMKGIILTAKHHDGFCLWPSRYTEHSVKNSPWRDGKGDVLRELAQACREYGLKMGIYISPWDRHEPSYGDSPRYNEFYKNQLREVLTSYGDVFEVWFDGACGEGPNGRRQEYDWPGFFEVVRQCQPKAVIFSDGGPDVRWVGNENGFANTTNWCLLRREEVWPGYPRYQELTTGHPDGTHWVPAEADVSIRPGWFYHPAEDSQVKSVEELLEIYYASVGRNAALLLNIPVDRRGLVPEPDATRLMEFRRALEAEFPRDLAQGAQARASQVRGNHPRFAAHRAIDGDPSTYWAPDDTVRAVWLEVEFPRPTTVNRLVLQEYIALGQRVEGFRVDVEAPDGWQKVAEGTTIGYRRILRFPEVTTRRVRLYITKARACPTIATVAAYCAGGSTE